MIPPYSKRNAPPPAELRYDVPAPVRSRIVAIFLQDLRGRSEQMFLQELEGLLVRQYGHLIGLFYEAARSDDRPVIEHLFSCDDARALDYIEFCFRTSVYTGGQDAVEQINAVFREEGIGYELTAYNGPQMAYGEVRLALPPEEDLPRVIRRDHQLLHQEVIEPALQLLRNPALGVANDEMLRAHAALRAGEHEDAITLCGSAFESVLKTICDLKKWPYDPDRDTCSKLVAICKDHGLFPSFYAPIFEATGTIRNKLGDAHGRGPKPMHTVTKEQADHAVQMTSAHILLLAWLAKMQ